MDTNVVYPVLLNLGGSIVTSLGMTIQKVAHVHADSVSEVTYSLVFSPSSFCFLHNGTLDTISCSYSYSYSLY